MRHSNLTILTLFYLLASCDGGANFASGQRDKASSDSEQLHSDVEAQGSEPTEEDVPAPSPSPDPDFTLTVTSSERTYNKTDETVEFLLVPDTSPSMRNHVERLRTSMQKLFDDVGEAGLKFSLRILTLDMLDQQLEDHTAQKNNAPTPVKAPRGMFQELNPNYNRGDLDAVYENVKKLDPEAGYTAFQELMSEVQDQRSRVENEMPLCAVLDYYNWNRFNTESSSPRINPNANLHIVSISDELNTVEFHTYDRNKPGNQPIAGASRDAICFRDVTEEKPEDAKRYSNYQTWTEYSYQYKRQEQHWESRYWGVYPDYGICQWRFPGRYVDGAGLDGPVTMGSSTVPAGPKVEIPLYKIESRGYCDEELDTWTCERDTSYNTCNYDHRYSESHYTCSNSNPPPLGTSDPIVGTSRLEVSHHRCQSHAQFSCGIEGDEVNWQSMDRDQAKAYERPPKNYYACSAWGGTKQPDAPWQDTQDITGQKKSCKMAQGLYCQRVDTMNDDLLQGESSNLSYNAAQNWMAGGTQDRFTCQAMAGTEWAETHSNITENYASGSTRKKRILRHDYLNCDQYWDGEKFVERLPRSEALAVVADGGHCEETGDSEDSSAHDVAWNYSVQAFETQFNYSCSVTMRLEPRCCASADGFDSNGQCDMPTDFWDNATNYSMVDQEQNFSSFDANFMECSDYACSLDRQDVYSCTPDSPVEWMDLAKSDSYRTESCQDFSCTGPETAWITEVREDDRVRDSVLNGTNHGYYNCTDNVTTHSGLTGRQNGDLPPNGYINCQHDRRMKKLHQVALGPQQDVVRVDTVDCSNRNSILLMGESYELRPGHQYCEPSALGITPPSGVTVSPFLVDLSLVTRHNSNMMAGTNIPEDIRVRFNSTGTLPGGLSVGTDYYTVNSTSTTFQLSTSLGGAPITIYDDGVGEHTMGRALTSQTVVRPYDRTLTRTGDTWTHRSEQDVANTFFGRQVRLPDPFGDATKGETVRFTYNEEIFRRVSEQVVNLGTFTFDKYPKYPDTTSDPAKHHPYWDDADKFDFEMTATEYRRIKDSVKTPPSQTNVVIEKVYEPNGDHVEGDATGVVIDDWVQTDPEGFIAMMEKVHPETTYTWHTIGNLTGTDCNDPAKPASRSDHSILLSEHSDGIVEDICNDNYDAFVARLVHRVLTEVELKYEIPIEALGLPVDKVTNKRSGRVLRDNEFRVSEGQIIFSRHVVEEGDEVHVDFGEAE